MGGDPTDESRTVMTVLQIVITQLANMCVLTSYYFQPMSIILFSSNHRPLSSTIVYSTADKDVKNLGVNSPYILHRGFFQYGYVFDYFQRLLIGC